MNFADLLRPKYKFKSFLINKFYVNIDDLRDVIN
jgi:hypothetical protein